MRVRGLLAALLLAAAPALAQSPPSAAQKTRVDAGPVSVPIEIREQFLGRSGEKTVVRFVLVVSRSDLRGPAGAGGPDTPQKLAFFLLGEVKKGGESVESFRVPVDVDLSGSEAGKPVQAAFLRSLPPGELSIQFRLEGAKGRLLATRAVDLTVPKMSAEFRAEDAGTDAAGLPGAAAGDPRVREPPRRPEGGRGAGAREDRPAEEGGPDRPPPRRGRGGRAGLAGGVLPRGEADPRQEPSALHGGAGPREDPEEADAQGPRLRRAGELPRRRRLGPERARRAARGPDRGAAESRRPRTSS